MKKILVSALLVAVASLSIQAQETPGRKHQQFRNQHKQAFQNLNLSDEQKGKMKTLNEDFRKKMQELKKNDDITVKEWKNRMQTLHKDHRAAIQGLLTNEQKAQIEKTKQERQSRQRTDRETRMEKMKVRLGLTDEQSAKLKANRSEMAKQMKALHENKTLTDEQRKQEMKNLRKKQKESLESILSEEQLKKLHERGSRHPMKQPV